MFTEQDYQQYFELIQEKEEEMVQFLSGLINQLSDESLSATLRNLLEDEKRHANIARLLMTYLK